MAIINENLIGNIGTEKNDIYDPVARIIVLGIGGAGNNAVNRMIDDGVKGVEFVGINTDKQDLKHCRAQVRVSIGEKVTGGRGAGAMPEVGESAANESKEAIRAILRETANQKKADMVFITCGMGGGTGTGAAPIIANIAKEEGILTVAVVTKPFRFEGKLRNTRALSGINKLYPNVDTLIVIPNDKLIDVVDIKDGFKEAFAKADEVLKQSIKGITDLINLPALVNLDFADVATVMRGKGLAHIAVGIGTGENKVKQAISKAIESPLLDTTIDGATDVIVSISGEVSLIDVDNALNEIEPKMSPDVNIIFGAREDLNLKDTVSVTIIATGVRDTQNNYPMNNYNRPNVNNNYGQYMGMGQMPKFQNNFAQQMNHMPQQNFNNTNANNLNLDSSNMGNMQSTPKFEELERETASSLFFNKKNQKRPQDDVRNSGVGINSTSTSFDSQNTDLGNISLPKNRKSGGSDLLPSFITDNLKK